VRAYINLNIHRDPIRVTWTELEAEHYLYATKLALEGLLERYTVTKLTGVPDVLNEAQAKHPPQLIEFQVT
jgi:hypothetical protein